MPQPISRHRVAEFRVAFGSEIDSLAALYRNAAADVMDVLADAIAPAHFAAGPAPQVDGEARSRGLLERLRARWLLQLCRRHGGPEDLATRARDGGWRSGG